MNPEQIDNVNKPSHYIGTYGLEVNDVTRNFIKGKAEMEAHRWCTTVEYLLRYKEKNGIEDLKKARKNLDWLIEELENGK
jgi:hypothetical protein|nr:MAG TPA: nucelotide kinase [Caudoviricetes sp.]